MASIVNGSQIKRKKCEDSGVYYNRLKTGMKLQADPTIQFLQLNGVKRLNYKDLRIKSSYNTYMHGGLPRVQLIIPGKVP